MGENQERGGLEELLEPGERVFWRASPERGALIQPYWILRALGWAVFLLSAGFLLAGLANILKGRPAQAIIFFIMFVPWAVAAFYLGYGRDYIFSRIAKSSQYILTDRRLIIRTGVLFKKDIVAQLVDIRAVETKQMKSERGNSVGEVIIRVGSPGLTVTRLGRASGNQSRGGQFPGRSRDLVLFGVQSPREIASILKAASNAARLRRAWPLGDSGARKGRPIRDAPMSRQDE